MLSLKVFGFIALAALVYIVLLLGAAFILTNAVPALAAPAEQITINENPPTVKGIYPGGTIGNCDVYLVDIDEPGRGDSTDAVLVCGDDRTSSGSP